MHAWLFTWVRNINTGLHAFMASTSLSPQICFLTKNIKTNKQQQKDPYCLSRRGQNTPTLCTLCCPGGGIGKRASGRSGEKQKDLGYSDDMIIHEHIYDSKVSGPKGTTHSHMGICARCPTKYLPFSTLRCYCQRWTSKLKVRV